MKIPRVSIIIPVYNVEDYIERSVVSLFVIKPYEMIVIWSGVI